MNRGGSVILNNADNDNYVAASKHQRPVWPLPPTAARRLCLPPHPRSSACYLVHVVLSAAQFVHHSPVVSVVHACSGALTHTAGVVLKNTDNVDEHGYR